MQFIKENKWMIGGVLGAVLMVYVYFTYFAGNSGPLLTATGNDSSQAVTQELLAALTNLRTIKLDESIFKDPVFVSLSDFGVTIPAQPVGRRNPFEPASGGGSRVSAPTSSPSN